METIEVGLGDVVTVAKAETMIVGRISGMTAFRGQATGVQIEELDVWLNANDGWLVVEKMEESDEIRPE